MEMNSNKKLSKKVFASMMETLNAFYVNFKVDLDNQLVVSVWYEALQNLDDNTFKELIKSYCMNNIYPPQSPTHLIQHMKDMVLMREPSGEEAWELTYGLLKRNRYDIETTTEQLKGDGKEACANSLKELRSRFKNLMTDDIPYVRKDFIEIYKRVVTQEVNQKVMLGDTSTLKLGNGGK
jgi:hypothetical protein